MWLPWGTWLPPATAPVDEAPVDEGALEADAAITACREARQHLAQAAAAIQRARLPGRQG